MLHHSGSPRRVTERLKRADAGARVIGVPLKAAAAGSGAIGSPTDGAWWGR